MAYKIRVTRSIPVTLQIDGQPIEGTISRFTHEQFSEFMLGFRKTQLPEADFLLLRREPSEDRLSDEDVRRRRRAEMTVERRAELERIERQDAAFVAAFVADTISTHLKLAPGQIEIIDGEQIVDVVTGADFVRAFAGRQDVLLAALTAIARQGATTDPTAPPAQPALIQSPTVQ